MPDASPGPFVCRKLKYVKHSVSCYERRTVQHHAYCDICARLTPARIFRSVRPTHPGHLCSTPQDGSLFADDEKLSRARSKFAEQYANFLRVRHSLESAAPQPSVLQHTPAIGGQPLDVFRLYWIVCSRGGIRKVRSTAVGRAEHGWGVVPPRCSLFHGFLCVTWFHRLVMKVLQWQSTHQALVTFTGA